MSSLIRRRGRNNWHLQYYVNGKRHVISLKTERRKVALQLKAKFDYELSQGILPGQRRIEIAAIVADYLTHMKANVRQTTYSRSKSYLRQLFGECCPSLKRGGSERAWAPRKGRGAKPFQVRYLEDVSPGMIQVFIDTRRAQDGIAEKTANEIRATLHALFNYAIRYNNFISKDPRYPNPAAAVRRVPQPRKPIVHLETLETIDRQLKAVNHIPVLHAALAIAIYCGLRRSEIVWLTKRDIDLENRKIHVRQKTINGVTWQPKTAESNRVVPVSRALHRILRRYRPPKDSQWYLPAPKGGLWDPDNLSRALDRANQKAGLKSGWLVFRHTFGSMLAQQNVSLYKISRLMGNSPEICRRHYAALTPSELMQEVEFDRREPLPPEELVILEASGKRTRISAPKKSSGA